MRVVVFIFLMINFIFANCDFTKDIYINPIKTYGIKINIQDIFKKIEFNNDVTIVTDGVFIRDSFDFKQMPLDGLLKYLQYRYGVFYKCNNKVVSINQFNIADTHLIELKHLDINQTRDIFDKNKLFKQFDLEEGRTIFFNDSLNAIYVNMDSYNLKKLEKLIEEFDERSKIAPQVREENRKLISKILYLKYINLASSNIEIANEKVNVESFANTIRELVSTKGLNGEEIDEDKLKIKIDKRLNALLVKTTKPIMDEIEELIKQLDKRMDLIDLQVIIVTANDGVSEQLGARLGFFRNSNYKRYGTSTSSGITQTLNEASEIPTETTTQYDNEAKEIVKETNKIYNNEDGQEYQEYQNKVKNIDFLAPLTEFALSSSIFLIDKRGALNFQLDAFQSQDLVEVVSRPHLITLNHKEAKIISGKSVSIPIVTENRLDMQSVESGVSISATPHIIEEQNSKECKEIVGENNLTIDRIGNIIAINSNENNISTNIKDTNLRLNYSDKNLSIKNIKESLAIKYDKSLFSINQLNDSSKDLNITYGSNKNIFINKSANTLLITLLNYERNSSDIIEIINNEVKNNFSINHNKINIFTGNSNGGINIKHNNDLLNVDKIDNNLTIELKDENITIKSNNNFLSLNFNDNNITIKNRGNKSLTIGFINATQIEEECGDKEKEILLSITVDKSNIDSVSGDQIQKSQNKVESEVIIRDGDTLVLGGLFDTEEILKDEGIPLLKEIPLLGRLFSNKTTATKKTELLFFITPSIVKVDEIRNNKTYKEIDLDSYKIGSKKARKEFKEEINSADFSIFNLEEE